MPAFFECNFASCVVNKQYFLTIFSHDESCDQSEAAQDGFNGSQHVCYLISFYYYRINLPLRSNAFIRNQFGNKLMILPDQGLIMEAGKFYSTRVEWFYQRQTCHVQSVELQLEF